MSATPKRSVPKVADIASARRNGPHVATLLGTLARWSAEDGLVVDYPGNPAGPRQAVSIVALSEEELSAIVASRQPLVIAFTSEGSPIVMGVVQPVPSRKSERANEKTKAVVDGEEVVLEGSERVELRCGKASIVLTKAGKVLIQGTYLSSRSSGAQRIRGGSVEVN